MPLLDIATAQPSLQNNLPTFRSQAILQNKFVFRNEKLFGFLWKPFFIPEKANNFNSGRFHVWRGGLMIKAVATLEPTRLTKRNKEFGLRVDMNSGTSAVPGFEQPSLAKDSSELDDREKLRRMRISRANKGNTPWNKGRKHTPETLQRIKERTRLAMQDPKVKMKLAKFGHAQSQETKMKIGVGVRIGWEKRRERIMLQETCLYEWQNLIAEASRRGVLGEEELQWNSYKIQDEQLEQEWVQSVAERKRTSRVKGSKRAPKSLEQRRKISESIAAKWADPSYRSRVYAGLVKYHGITDGVERKRRITPSSDGETEKRNPSKRKVDSDEFANPEPRSQTPRGRRKSKVAPYKDPLASSKLEMLKSIRAQRAAIESKKMEAIVRAKLLIAEAEKAANALEAAAKQSPLAQASLIETRRLIAEAMQSISSIDEGLEDLSHDGSISMASPEFVSHAELETSAEFDDPDLNQIVERKVNGAHTLGSTNFDEVGFSCEKSAFQDLVDASGDNDILGFNFERPGVRDSVDGTGPSNFCIHDMVNGKEALPQMSGIDVNLAPRLLDNAVRPPSFMEHLGDQRLNGSRKLELEHDSQLNGIKLQPREEEKPPKLANVTKKWVRGRLVEVGEGK